MNVMKKICVKKSFLISLLAGLIIMSFCQPCFAVNQKSHRKKINHLKWLENVETGKLYKNQQKLENITTSLQKSKGEYNTAQSKLTSLQRDLAKATGEYRAIDFQMRRRIRQIFKTQRHGFFELLLVAEDVNQFNDRFYFEGLIIKQDFNSMKEARQKAKEIASLKRQIETEKRTISRSINTINKEQKDVKKEIVKNQRMILKLQTDRKTYEKAERELAKQSGSIQSMLSHKSSKESYKLGAKFLWPIRGRITSPFGWRTHPIFKSRTFHSGLDIAGPYNGSVKAADNGKVIYVGWYGGYGKVVMIDHGKINGKSITTLYAHLNSFNVSNGQRVQRGQVIAKEGTTGYSTGPHVHFEVRINGKPQNPLNYL